MLYKVKYILQLPVSAAEEKLDTDCDIFGIKFSGKNWERELETLKNLLPEIKKPLMLRGCGDDTIDEILLPEVMKILDRECIIGIANENNYKSLVPAVIKGGHKLIIRTPIDINLAKEMNILTSDMGLGLDKILMDTDIGGLGYGFEYGYSIMEKIKLEGADSDNKKGDKYLSMPLISFAAEETAKTKEAKDENLALYLEITSASGVLAAGADYIVLTRPQAVKVMKGLV